MKRHQFDPPALSTTCGRLDTFCHIKIGLKRCYLFQSYNQQETKLKPSIQVQRDYQERRNQGRSQGKETPYNSVVQT